MKKERIFWGIFFILAAVYLVVSQMGILPQVGVWSIILTVFMLWMFIEGIRHRNFFEILFAIAFVCIIYDEQLGITAYTPWTVLGVALLGSIGLSMLFGKKNNKPHFEFVYDGDDDSGRRNTGVDARNCDGERVHCENNFGTAIRYIDSDNLCEADLENNFGTMNVYFDNAIVQCEIATVCVDNNFGEMNLYIPKEWKVSNNLDRAFGSIAERGRCLGTSNVKLRINGDCAFGKVTIYYV